ncbi:hypothetical protein BUE80_DR004606 [Diplocarpon rosae]|nr:hypothetical protein BUE80_DR004606 [Diplocarpon rosae]
MKIFLDHSLKPSGLRARYDPSTEPVSSSVLDDSLPLHDHACLIFSGPWPHSCGHSAIPGASCNDQG